MKLLNVHCTNCGAAMKVSENAKVITCEYCNQDFILDDEVKRFMLTNAEQAGYEFEKGRQRAIREAEQEEKDREPIEVVCTHCGQWLKTEKKAKTAVCYYCKKTFVVEQAVDVAHAWECEKNGQYDFAIKLYNKLLNADPNNSLASQSVQRLTLLLDDHVYFTIKVPCFLTKDETLEVKRNRLEHVKRNGKRIIYYYDKMTNIKTEPLKWFSFDYPGYPLSIVYVGLDTDFVADCIKDAQKGEYDFLNILAETHNKKFKDLNSDVDLDDD